MLREYNLNTTPQHCSLVKDKIIEKLEDIVKKCTNMTKLRTEANEDPVLKAAFIPSLKSVSSLVESRFESMFLKRNRVICSKSCDDNDIDGFFFRLLM